MPSATHLSSGLHTTAASGIAGPSMLSYTGAELVLEDLFRMCLTGGSGVNDKSKFVIGYIFVGFFSVYI